MDRNRTRALFFSLSLLLPLKLFFEHFFDVILHFDFEWFLFPLRGVIPSHRVSHSLPVVLSTNEREREREGCCFNFFVDVKFVRFFRSTQLLHNELESEQNQTPSSSTSTSSSSTSSSVPPSPPPRRQTPAAPDPPSRTHTSSSSSSSSSTFSSSSCDKRREYESLSVKELRSRLSLMGIAHSHCIEKSELVDLLVAADASAKTTHTNKRGKWMNWIR